MGKAENVQEVILDISERFIEVLTKHHKTAKQDQVRLLPIAAPAFGITGECWAESFLNLREEAIGECRDGPILPAVAVQASLSFSSRPIETNEATDILRFLLTSFPEASALTSHSCKETPLSWLAKAGADKQR